MNIWKDIEIEYKGETYTVKPTLELINKLEQRDGCSLTSLMMRAAKADIPSSISAIIIATVVNHAGGKTTPEQVYQELGGISIELSRIAADIIIACLPQPKTSEKKSQE